MSSRFILAPLFLTACAPSPTVGLNEIGGAWVEIHNQGDEVASIGEWSLQFELRSPWTIPPDVEMEGGGFRVLEGVDVSEGTLILRSADGETVQEVDVPALAEGETYGRVPDGSGAWEILDGSTRGSSNE